MMAGLLARSLRLLGRERGGERRGQEDTVFLLHFLPVTSDILFTFGAITKKTWRVSPPAHTPSLRLCVYNQSPASS